MLGRLRVFGLCGGIWNRRLGRHGATQRNSTPRRCHYEGNGRVRSAAPRLCRNPFENRPSRPAKSAALRDGKIICGNQFVSPRPTRTSHAPMTAKRLRDLTMGRCLLQGATKPRDRTSAGRAAPPAGCCSSTDATVAVSRGLLRRRGEHGRDVRVETRRQHCWFPSR
jgi:hypothetical protein